MRAEHADIRLWLKQGGTGDAIALSAFIRDCRKHRPDITLSVNHRQAEEIFKYDDRVYSTGPGTKDVLIDYRAILEKTNDVKYVYLTHALFARETGIAIPEGPPRPSLVLSEEERTPSETGEYGIISAGVKADIPVKQYPIESFAQIVAATQPMRWIQVGAIHDGRLSHHQTGIPGCENRLGRTDLRELFRLIAHASCVLCHVSLAMVIASALGTPCIALAGGRENPQRYDGMGIEYLHTIGRLDCCRRGGCGCCVAVAGHNDSGFPKDFVCEHPVLIGRRHVGECMTLLSPDRVVATVEANRCRRSSERAVHD